MSRFSSFSRYMSCILTLGDVMLDRYTFGKVERLNPESPAPLMRISRSETRIGGAGNVATNIATLGNVRSHIIGCVGTDAGAQSMRELEGELGVTSSHIAVAAPTIVKERFVETTYQQQLLRADYENTVMLSSQQIMQIMENVRDLKPDLIVASDYMKGFWSAELVAELLIYKTQRNIRLLVDSKPPHMPWFTGATIIKPNYREFCQAMNVEGAHISELEIHALARDFTRKFLTTLVLTRSEKGALICDGATGEVTTIPTRAENVFDVTGAGDTFMAGLAVALHENRSLLESVRFANAASGIAVGKVGTAVVSRADIQAV